LRRVFHILTKPVPYTFVSVNRRNNEARAHVATLNCGKLAITKYPWMYGYYLQRSTVSVSPVFSDVEHREPFVTFFGVEIEAAQVSLKVQLRQRSAAVAARQHLEVSSYGRQHGRQLQLTNDRQRRRYDDAIEISDKPTRRLTTRVSRQTSRETGRGQ